MNVSNLNRHVYHQIFYHITWSVKDRQLLIDQYIKQPLYKMIKKEIQKAAIDCYGIGGMEDHIHILVRCAPIHIIPKVLKDIKGSSSHFVNYELKPNFYFQWQRGYGIFSISKWDVPKIRNYILNQRRHHQELTTISDLERTNTWKN